MGTAGMISRRNFNYDRRLDRTIAVAPFGIRSKERVRGEPLLKGIRPGIGSDDIVLLFNGTIVEWYDTELLIRAMGIVAKRRSDARLVFLGTDHPDRPGPSSFGSLGGGAARRALELARELGLLEKHVFFNFGWAGDAVTEQHLLEADAGVSTYFEGLETRYSFRVRYLDLLWASLPIVCTRGDVVSELVERRGLGIAVPERDVAALAAAIEHIASDAALRASCRRNLDELREQYRWERTLSPLVEFCRDPSRVAVSRRERLGPLVSRTADWAVSWAHYAARYELRERLGRLRSGGNMVS
jgi:glycosyltransferase involved in cell wall biosynthesis